MYATSALAKEAAKEESRKVGLGCIQKARFGTSHPRAPAPATAPAPAPARQVSFDAFLKAVRRALPTKSDRSHGKLAKALALDVQASRGVDFESILGVTDPPAHALAAPTPAGGPAAAASAVAVVASKYPEPEPPRYLTASDGYVRKKSRFMELLHLQVCPSAPQPLSPSAPQPLVFSSHCSTFPPSHPAHRTARLLSSPRAAPLPLLRSHSTASR